MKTEKTTKNKKVNKITLTEADYNPLGIEVKTEPVKTESVEVKTETPVETPKVSIPVPQVVKKPEPLFSTEAQKFYNLQDKDGYAIKDFIPIWMMQKIKNFLHRTIEIFDFEKIVIFDDKAPEANKFCFICGKLVQPRIFSIIDKNGKIANEKDELGNLIKKGSFIKRLISVEGQLVAVPATGCGSPYNKSHLLEIRSIKYYENGKDGTPDKNKPVYFTGRDGEPKPLKIQSYSDCISDCETMNAEFARKKYAAEKHATDFNRRFAAPDKKQNSGGRNNYNKTRPHLQKDSDGGWYYEDATGKRIWTNMKIGTKLN